MVRIVTPTERSDWRGLALSRRTTDDNRQVRQDAMGPHGRYQPQMHCRTGAAEAKRHAEFRRGVSPSPANRQSKIPLKAPLKARREAPGEAPLEACREPRSEARPEARVEAHFVAPRQALHAALREARQQPRVELPSVARFDPSSEPRSEPRLVPLSDSSSDPSPEAARGAVPPSWSGWENCGSGCA